MARSDKYQYKFYESFFPNDTLAFFPNSQSIYKSLNPFSYNEDLFTLKDQLKERTFKLAEKYLTDRQWQILQLLIQGKTQWEIATIIGINQSSVIKSIHGNTDYKSTPPKTYGGLIRRMQVLVSEDKRIKELLTKINDIIQDDIWA